MEKYKEFNKELENRILELHSKVRNLCNQVNENYKSSFKEIGLDIKIDLIEMVFKGKNIQQVQNESVFQLGYESSVGIMILEVNEAIEEHYIPVWECKKKMLRMQGYLYINDILEIEEEIKQYLKEIIDELK